MDEWTWSACHVELSREFMSHRYFNQVDIASHCVQNGFELIICRYDERGETGMSGRKRGSESGACSQFRRIIKCSMSKNSTRRRLNYMVSREERTRTHTHTMHMSGSATFFSLLAVSLSVSCANNGFVCCVGQDKDSTA